MSSSKIVLPLIVLAILSAGAIQRNMVWESGFSFWSDVVRKAPQKARGYNNLADSLMDFNRFHEALDHLYQAVKLDRWYIEPHYNIAMCMIKLGQLDKAVPELEEVIRINRTLKKGHFGAKTSPAYEMQANSNLGNIYYTKGMNEEAVYYFTEAIKIDPRDTSTRFNLAITYEKMGSMENAAREFQKVLKITPSDEGALRGYNRTSSTINQ